MDITQAQNEIAQLNLIVTELKRLVRALTKRVVALEKPVANG